MRNRSKVAFIVSIAYVLWGTIHILCLYTLAMLIGLGILSFPQGMSLIPYISVVAGLTTFLGGIGYLLLR